MMLQQRQDLLVALDAAELGCRPMTRIRDQSLLGGRDLDFPTRVPNFLEAPSQ
jgi:hypothetical protein